MTLEEVNSTLLSTGYPVAYGRFSDRDEPCMPYIVYAEIESNNFYADGVVYLHQGVIQVDLYTELKDPVTEDILESALSDFSWEKREEYDDEQNCNIVSYNFEITG